ncbi:hypothetical protein DdX_19838 [Ditylenchus destructor]|uniref:Uncharacterized protein n=1 Tax=Ditylenchus destructor TaxID=166010 RepID=A0AAD4QTZ2_9BILA|nr:hypothetical protein DdX_19838 [Ditylenchus destructor]
MTWHSIAEWASLADPEQLAKQELKDTKESAIKISNHTNGAKKNVAEMLAQLLSQEMRCLDSNDSAKLKRLEDGIKTHMESLESLLASDKTVKELIEEEFKDGLKAYIKSVKVKMIKVVSKKADVKNDEETFQSAFSTLNSKQ